MKELKQADIALIGNRNQTAHLRLAGIRRWRVFEDDDPGLGDKARKALLEYLADPSVGVVILPETWMVHVRDIVKSQIQKGPRAAAIVIGIPSGYEPGRAHVKEYYRHYTRKLIGFNIEI